MSAPVDQKVERLNQELHKMFGTKLEVRSFTVTALGAGVTLPL